MLSMNRELWNTTYLRKSHKMKGRGEKKKKRKSIYIRKDAKQEVKLSSNLFFSNLRVGFPT